MNSVLHVRKDGRKKNWVDEPRRVFRMQNGWEDLANAIILQTVKDYRNTLKRLKVYPDSIALKREMRRCERFFHSAWFGTLSEVDPERILNGIREEEAV